MAQDQQLEPVEAPFIPLRPAQDDDLDDVEDEQAGRVPTDGLRSLADGDDAIEDPGERFRTATQIRADDLTEQQLDELRRFALPDDELLDDDDLVTGAISDRDNAGDDPFEPLGLRTGALTWFPVLDLAVGYDTNPGESVNGREVTTFTIAPQLRLETDWRRHAFEGEVIGSAELFDDDRDTEFGLNADGSLRLDVGRASTITFRSSYVFDTEQESDENAPAGASDVTDTQELRGGVTVARQVGIISVQTGGEFARFLFSDTPLVTGGSASNDDRDRYEFAGSLRLERTEGPLFRPFVESELTLRDFDDDLDRNGLDRDSFGYRASLGLNVAEDKPLRGSASIGLVGEDFDDDALDDLLTVAVQAALTWDITSLTAATLNVETEVSPTTQAGSGVEVTRSVDLGVTHALRRNVDIRAGAEVSESEFSGIDTSTRTYGARGGITWRTSRSIAFRLDGTYEHEPNGGDDIDRFTLEAGVTLRR
ncbi:MAG: outer membrane beta-barrel protein [Pseudomonadota bacterium]